MNRNLKSLSDRQAEFTCQAALHHIGNKLIKEEVGIREIGDFIPGSIMIQDLTSMVNTYMNKTGCEILHAENEELQSMGPNYFDVFFPPEEIEVLKPALMRFAAGNDSSTLYSFFQRVKPLDSSTYQWYFTTSRIYPVGGAPGALQMMHVAINAQAIGGSAKKISRLVEDHSYAIDNYTKFSLLSKREKEIISLVASGKSSYDISDMLFISLHTVNNHRKNINAKLACKSFAEMIRFAIAFDLI